MLALYGLKWNPFIPSVPTEALHVSTRLESFCWRVQQLAGEGGFALVTGSPGCGKSAALRILSASLPTQRDVTVGVISRPQASIADFYREMGELFGVELRPHNRYGGAKILRQRWQAHIQSTLSRPVLLVDEAQEMQSVSARRAAPAGLCRSRLPYPADHRAGRRWTPRRTSAAPMSSFPLLAACGCAWRLNAPRHRNSRTASATPCSRPARPALMTPEVIAAICDHAQGNPRALMIMAGELLEAAAQRDARQIDETLFFETCAVPAAREIKAATRRRR